METLELLRERCNALIVAQSSQDPAEIEKAEEAIVATAMRVFGCKQNKESVERGEETMRNIEKAVAEGHEIVKNRPRLDLDAVELKAFLDQIESGEDVISVIADAYMAGIAVGSRNSKRKQEKNFLERLPVGTVARHEFDGSVSICLPRRE